MICLAPELSQSFFVHSIQSKKKKKKSLKKESFLRKSGSVGLNKNRKEGSLTVQATAIKKGSTTSIRKYTNELKIHEKTVKTAIKQDLSPNLKPLDYAIWAILQNKTNVTSHPNIGSL